MEGMSDNANIDWEEWKQVQHNMKLEGWLISDEELRKFAVDYEANGLSSLPEKIVRVADESGRPLAEVAKEVLAEFRRRNEK